MNLRTPLSKVKGLGSAKEGAQHWWNQRMTAIALVPLALWFSFSVALIAVADFTTVSAWISAPLNTVLMILAICVGFYHGYLGLQVIIEDYVAHEPLKIAMLIGIGLLAVLFVVLGVVSVLKISFGA
ncbi:MAG: succinate dehydrogenase, hydrophobic membrane anchor protein [Gammaproteobacteria bacterium]|nr:succinate dehydrogenase, hydrophobic membrane anchor protein [Gammaproteobacteria bacterium]